MAFPIVVSEKLLTYDDMLEDIEPCCSAKIDCPDNFIDACKEEFLYILGADGFKELSELSDVYTKQNVDLKL